MFKKHTCIFRTIFSTLSVCEYWVSYYVAKILMNVWYKMGSAVIEITEPTLVEAQHAFLFLLQCKNLFILSLLLKPNCLSFLSAEELLVHTFTWQYCWSLFSSISGHEHAVKAAWAFQRCACSLDPVDTFCFYTGVLLLHYIKSIKLIVLFFLCQGLHG